MASPAAPNIHWSKDFVEHLRTVHFALIAVALGLIVVVLSLKPYKMDVALRELHEILQLKKLWSPDWFEGHGQSEDFAPRNGAKARPNGLDVYLDEVTPVKSKKSFYGKATWAKTKKSALIDFKLPAKNWSEDEDSHCLVSLDSFPTTLKDFQPWWNSLQSACVAYFPQGVGRSGKILAGPSKTVGEIFVYEENAEHPVTDVFGARRVELDLTADVKDDSFEYFADDAGESDVFDIQLLRVSRVRLTQQDIIAAFPQWRNGSYEKSFFDLANAAGDVTNLELIDADKTLTDKGGKTEELFFEVFGLKFPAKQITFWGVILLAGVQLYLFVYLKHFSGKLQPEDPGWDVPWIGMDESALGRIVFLTTLLIFPCLATILLSYRELSQLITPWNARSWAELVGFISAVAASTLLGVLSWKYRPRTQ